MATQIFVTGASGLIGGDVLLRLLCSDRRARARVLVRSEAAWQTLAARLGPHAARVEPVAGDVTAAGLGIDMATRARLQFDTTHVLHCAADTQFSQKLNAARRTNTSGTAHVLELASGCPELQRYVQVSTAFVAGRLTGRIAEAELPDVPGWVNAYERSKHEAEALVRAAGVPWVIVRPSTVVCDGVDGAIRQVNAVHRALLLFRAGLAAMVPGTEAAPVDVVTTDHVAGATAVAVRLAGIDGRTFHLCAGAGALPLGELIDRAHAWWGADARWLRRSVPRPALTSLETYRLFEQAVAETGDARLRAITRSLSHFVPQLALPKHFETGAAERVLGSAPRPVSVWWSAMLRQLDVLRPARRSHRPKRRVA